MSAPRVEVTARDLDSGREDTIALDPDGYVIVTGKNMYEAGVTKYGNGTIVITVKREVQS